MSRRPTSVDLDHLKTRDTPLSHCFRDPSNLLKVIFLPKSETELSYAGHQGIRCTVTMPEWLAEEKGLD